MKKIIAAIIAILAAIISTPIAMFVVMLICIITGISMAFGGAAMCLTFATFIITPFVVIRGVYRKLVHTQRTRIVKSDVDKFLTQEVGVPDKHTSQPRDEINQLAILCQAGLISDSEFKILSEGPGLSTGEKAQSIIKAISELSEQYKQKAMSESNYHAALWSLLDKLDRKI